MKGEKDEGKRIVPLFPPGLRRDEINLFGDKIVSAECSRPRAMVPIVVGGSTFASQASSSNNVSWTEHNGLRTCILTEHDGAKEYVSYK